MNAEQFATMVTSTIPRRAKQVDLSVSLQRVADIMRANFVKHFNDEEGPKGPWPTRKDPGPQHPLLQLTRALFNATQEGLGSITLIEPTGVTLAIDPNVIPYAATHQHGRTFGRGSPIPQRKYMWLDAETKLRCKNLVARAYRQAVFQGLLSKHGISL